MGWISFGLGYSAGRRSSCSRRSYRSLEPYTIPEQRFRLALFGFGSIFPGSLVLGGFTGAITHSQEVGAIALVAGLIVAWMFFYRAATLGRPDRGLGRGLYVLTVTCSTIIGPVLLLVGTITASLQLAGRAPYATWHDTLTEISLGIIGSTIAGLALRHKRIKPAPEAPPTIPPPAAQLILPPDDDGPLNPRMYYSNRR